ncbi:MAG: hypothetical protein ACTSVE_11145 [Candidatus Helarchaeota archaeon]
MNRNKINEIFDSILNTAEEFDSSFKAITQKMYTPIFYPNYLDLKRNVEVDITYLMVINPFYDSTQIILEVM